MKAGSIESIPRTLRTARARSPVAAPRSQRSWALRSAAASAPAGPGLWSSWARALSARRYRSAPRWGAPALRLALGAGHGAPAAARPGGGPIHRHLAIYHRHAAARLRLALGPLRFVLPAVRAASGDAPATAPARSRFVGDRGRRSLRSFARQVVERRTESARVLGRGGTVQPTAAAAGTLRATASEQPESGAATARSLALASTDLAHRLTRSRRRQEARPAPTAPPVLARAVAPAAAPVSLEPTLPASAGEPRSIRPDSRRRPSQRRSDLPQAAPAMPGPQQIEALTEQVVRRIDRRLVAWRERTGRT